ncbi:MAG: type II toxin-antitoxin system PemK/MazF family toxin [Pseudomonadota bacterium]|nr:type II toxin-antitoxin system PemK/MazF family toxin [Pseudomonadota bacterium]
MPKGIVKRGEVWMVDFEPQTFKAEPGKRARPSLIIQTDLLNDLGHPTTMVIPGTTDVEPDAYPLRVFLGPVRKPGEQPKDTDLLIDQIKAISNDRFMGDGALTTVSTNHMKQVTSALKTLLSL